MEAAAKAGPQRHDRKNPFLAEMIRHEPLTRPGSNKDTRHFVLSLKGSGLTYTPGDSLAIFARNPPALVDEVVRLLGFDGAPVREALTRQYILNRANRKILTGLSERVPQGEQRNRLMEILDNDEVCREYLYTRDYIDILSEFDEANFESPEAFLTQLSSIPPRLYSIASSLAAHPDEVHLCVGIVRYEAHGRKRAGLATGFLADHAKLRVKDIPVYVQEARHFHLPEDSARDIIMIGPGTGVAPFRAFLEQRMLDGAKGRNWLFFGEQHRATDFLYGDEFTRWHKGGLLHGLDLAFSRDQAEKIYVQTRMQEHAREIWDWLQRGAYLYVCGDAKRMAKDVHQTVIEIARDHGGMTPEAAAAYVTDTLMKKERRYLRDVY
jgi:sulfite reductase (NADPH) flavoprotein alpha-component